jgi:transcriptional regulator with XRE-family HTH domain
MFKVRLNNIKVAKGYTIEQMAALAKVSWPTMQRWLRGVHAPHPIARPSVYQALEGNS